MENGHHSYRLGLSILALDLLGSMLLVVYVTWAFFNFLANPGSASLPSVTAVSVAAFVLAVFGVVGLVLLYSGINDFMSGTRQAVDWLVTLREPPVHTATAKIVAFVCSDCGGDIAEDEKACPHCGATIDGD